MRMVLAVRRLQDATIGTSELDAQVLDILDKLAPMLIGGLVRDIHDDGKNAEAAKRLVRDATHTSKVEGPYEARCECGSGRPYSGCCGSH